MSEGGDNVKIVASVPLDGSGKAAADVPAAGAGADAPKPADAGAPAGGGAGNPSGDLGTKPAAGEGSAAPVNPADLTKKPDAPAKTDEQARAEAATGLDLTPFSQEFNANGKLSDESYAKLAEKGFTKEITDTYIRGVQAQVTERLTTLAQSVGGVDTYNAILEWGKTGLSEGERAEAVKMLGYGSADAARTYLAGLNARFVAANGKAPGKIAGGGAAPAGDVFASRADQAKAMKDPRYKTDPAYRDSIVQKSVRSFSKGSSKARSKVKPTARRARSKTTTHRAPKGKR